MKKIKKEYGITLVALVITIIILLILAGISIQAITNTGLFEQVEEAKKKTENAQIEEKEILENYYEQMTSYGGGKQSSAEETAATTHTATEITYGWDEIANMAKVISNTTSINENTLEVKVIIDGKTKILGVGDTKTLDGRTVRILGFNHDELADSVKTTAYGSSTATGKAGISFEYVDFLTSAQMNSSATNAGGWKDTELREILNGITYSSLITTYHIKKVKKDYIPVHNVASIEQTEDYLWLLSCGEIWDNGYGQDRNQIINGTRGYAITTEGKRYKYYRINLETTKYNTSNNIVKKPVTSNSDWWWLRSPNFAYRDSFCYVLSNGTCSRFIASNSGGVAPGFSI